MSQLFTSGDRSTAASVSAPGSVLYGRFLGIILLA